MVANLKNTAEDYSKYVNVNMNTKLQPVSKSIDGMLARLEEFQTIISFDRQEWTNAKDLLTSVIESKDELKSLFARIDAAETLVHHAKANMDNLEAEVDKAEKAICPDSASSKITNMLSPLFKRHADTKSKPEEIPEFFKTEDYFYS